MAGAATTTTAVADTKNHYKMSMVWIVAGISWGAISYSYAGSIIGTTLGQPSFNVYMGLATNKHAESLIGTMTGLFYAGGVFGCVLNSILADRIGRKMTVLTAYIILLISSACLTGSVNIGMFIAFRFFVGLGAYMLYLSVPLWVVELVPPKGRSITAGIVGLFGVIGYIVAAYVGVGFFYLKSNASAQWRGPLAVGCFPSLMGIILMPWLPESPRWLLRQDRNEEAWDIVRKLHSDDSDPDNEYATAEFYQMTKQTELESRLDSSWLEILRRPSYRKRSIIVIGLPCIIYSTGNLVVTTYAASIFTSLGYDAGQSLQFLSGLYLAAIAGNLISLTYVDRIPRNVIMSIGVLVCTTVLAIETGLVSGLGVDNNEARLRGAAAFLFFFLFSFNLFIEGPSWYYASEVFPTHIRSKGMTMNVIGFACINIMWLEIAPTAFKNIGWKYYLVFISVSVFGAAAIYFLFPNTLGKPLEEVAQLFGDDDLVAIYQNDIEIDHEKHKVVEHNEQVQQAPQDVLEVSEPKAKEV